MKDTPVWRWLQGTKHNLYVAKKHAGWKAAKAGIAVTDVKGRLRERFDTYEYAPGRYPRTLPGAG